MERDPRLSLPDLEAEERATYYTARSVPVDSAALYEAVNAWVEAITADKEVVGASRYEELDASNRAIDRTHEAVLDAAYALAQTRYQRRRAQQPEQQS